MALPEHVNVESVNTSAPSLDVMVGPVTSGFVLTRVMLSSPLSVTDPSEAITVQETRSPRTVVCNGEVMESVAEVVVLVRSVVPAFAHVYV